MVKILSGWLWGINYDRDIIIYLTFQNKRRSPIRFIQFYKLLFCNHLTPWSIVKHDTNVFGGPLVFRLICLCRQHRLRRLCLTQRIGVSTASLTKIVQEKNVWSLWYLKRETVSVPGWYWQYLRRTVDTVLPVFNDGYPKVTLHKASSLLWVIIVIAICKLCVKLKYLVRFVQYIFHIIINLSISFTCINLS